MSADATITEHDRTVLCRLAERKRQIADDPVNCERRDRWYRHDAGEVMRPLVLAEFGGVRDPLTPLPDSALESQAPWARGVERGLRAELYQFEVLRDDHVVEPVVNLNWQVQTSDYGVQPVQHVPDNDGHLGARSWEPAIADLDRDIDKLRPRTFSVDREATLAHKARLEAVFGGLLDVRIRGHFWWTMGLTIRAIDLIGLQGLMLSMYDNPNGLHRLMAFLRDDHLAFADWLEREGLLSLDNENDYIGSGSMGYTRALPQPDWTEGSPVRLQDLWVLLESQETVGVGPDQFEEFVFPYQVSIAERFGRCYYGCCEPVHTRWHVLQRLPNLARLSVAPWADQECIAQALGRDTVFSRKPNPALISTPHFDEKVIRDDLRTTLVAARGCRLEIIMKDVHTLNNEPNRIARWVELARQMTDEVW